MSNLNPDEISIVIGYCMPPIHFIHMEMVAAIKKFYCFCDDDNTLCLQVAHNSLKWNKLTLIILQFLSTHGGACGLGERPSNSLPKCSSPDPQSQQTTALQEAGRGSC